jgi:Spy/CpxP family protein refolding chaperone
MNKLLAVMMVAVLPGLALASGEMNTTAQVRALKPVISIIDLTSEQAQQLEKVHGDYQAKKAVLDVDYNAKIDAVVEVKATNVVSKSNS